MVAKSNQTQFAILGHLSLKPLSGYGLKKIIAQSTQHFWSESYGNLYPSLEKLIRAKLIKVEETERSAGKRQQTIYSITALGMEHLLQWLKQNQTDKIQRDELLLKIFFGKHIEPENIIAHLEIEIASLSTKIRFLENLNQELPIRQAKNEHLPYWLMTIACGLKTLSARLEWCFECIQELQKR